MISTPPDEFDDWFRAPVADNPTDSPFIVRRAAPEEFERVYDTVDAAFGRKRPRRLYDWLYRDNPTGIARSWILEERATGVILKAGTSFPWPIWRGDERLRGLLGGDAATLPEWQRKGLSAIRRKVRDTHPWNDSFCNIAGPNAGSRAVIRKSGRSARLLGRLRGGVALLAGGPALEKLGVPSALASPAGRAADAFFSKWPGRQGLPGTGVHPSRIRRVQRFTSDFDEVTERHMHSPKFWCPHNADFLNWRYLDHPVETYEALTMLGGDGPVGYAVVRLAGEGATLSEFVMENDDSRFAADLLSKTMKFARDAGCSYLNFFSTSTWRHWPLFRRTGFLPYRSKNQLEASSKRFGPELQNEKNWQILPGDRDYH